jgi:hypothetical protein
LVEKSWVADVVVGVAGVAHMGMVQLEEALVDTAVVGHRSTFVESAEAEKVVYCTCGVAHDPKEKLQKLGSSIEECDS